MHVHRRCLNNNSQRREPADGGARVRLCHRGYRGTKAQLFPDTILDQSSCRQGLGTFKVERLLWREGRAAGRSKLRSNTIQEGRCQFEGLWTLIQHNTKVRWRRGMADAVGAMTGDGSSHDGVVVERSWEKEKGQKRSSVCRADETRGGTK